MNYIIVRDGRNEPGLRKGQSPDRQADLRRQLSKKIEGWAFRSIHKAYFLSRTGGPLIEVYNTVKSLISPYA
jgi:hypothetical protein